MFHHVGGSTQHDEPSGDRSLFSPPSSIVNSQATTPVIGNPRYGDDPGLENDSLRAAILSSMIDNSGRATAPSATEAFLSSANPTRIDGSRTMGYGFGSNRTEDLVSSHDHHDQGPFRRSQSAAPSSPSLGPPPGMPALHEGVSSRGGLSISRNPNDVVTRPASTGLLDSATVRPSTKTLRPSAKTLMDWIQEDFPQDDAPRNNFGNEGTTNLPEPFDRLHSLSGTQQLYDHQPHQDPVGVTNAQYFVPRHQQQQPSMDQLTQQQVPRIRFESNSGAGMQHVVSVGTLDSPAVAVPSQQQGIQEIPQQIMAQRFVPAGFEGDAAKPEVQSIIYPSGKPNPQQQHPNQSPRPQQVYVASNGRTPPPGAMVSNPDAVYYPQQIEVSPPRIQTQVLPSGQTFYIQDPAPSSQQSATSYATYTTTIQYHPTTGHLQSNQTQQPTRIVSTAPASLIRQPDGSYISAVPIQSGNATPITYWQTDASGQGQTVIVGAPGVSGHLPQPVTVSHAQSPQHLQSAVESHFSPNGHQGRHGQSHTGRGSREKPGGISTTAGGGGSGARSRHKGHQSRRTEQKAHAASSQLLEEFRSNKNRQWTVPQIEGHIVEFCQDQNGSRFIQQRLELGDGLEQEVVVREVLPSIRRLRNDVFGNYVVQKLLDFGSPQVRASIRDTLEGEMLQLSLQMYGCRVVQKALEVLDFEDLSRLLSEFHHNVLSCIHDQNGNHVIQKCIEVMNTRAKTAEASGDHDTALHSRELIDFIINDVLVNATTLSCHPFGCRVHQRILENSDETRKNKLLDEVQKSHKRLLDDQYGNYVIQHVLEYGRVEDRDSILAIVVENGLLSLSRQKFASNVVEKLLKYGNAPQRKAIAREMLKKANQSPSGMNIQGGDSRGDSSVVLLMVRDAYANYVVQTTLDVVPNSEERTSLLNELNSHADELVSLAFSSAS